MLLVSELELSVGCESRANKSDSGVVSEVLVVGCSGIAAAGVSTSGCCK